MGAQCGRKKACLLPWLTRCTEPLRLAVLRFALFQTLFHSTWLLNALSVTLKTAHVALYAISSERGNGGFRWRILVKLPRECFLTSLGFDFENKLDIAFSERNRIAILIIQRPLEESDSPRVTG